MVGISVTQLVFTGFFASFLSWIFRRADIWYPFTPTWIGHPSRWESAADVFRWALSFLFFMFIPAVYLMFVLSVIASYPANLEIEFSPNFLHVLHNIWKIWCVIVLIVPVIGIYNLWQSIVRLYGGWSYSDNARLQIEKQYPNAFKNVQSTSLWALLYIFLPIAGFGVALGTGLL